MSEFGLPGALRRIRRAADLSQRELAAACGVATSVVAHAEAGRRGLSVELLARAAALAGLRLALLDRDGREVPAMADGAVRDLAGRRFPAHLDTMSGDRRWWRYEHRYDRPRPLYTFGRDRAGRDLLRRSGGTPEDHQLPQPTDFPAYRAQQARRAADADRERRFLAGEFARLPDPFVCTCPAECDDLDDRSGRPVHAPACPCDCDLA